MNKKLQLHALPTDKGPYSLEKWGPWWFDTSDGVYSDREPKAIGHHLYLTSDDEIKEGDWMLVNDSHVRQCTEVGGDKYYVDSTKSSIFKSVCRKLVATTNFDLWNTIEYIGEISSGSVYNSKRNVPMIPQSLIEYFVKQQGNVKEVLAEYNEWFDNPDTIAYQKAGYKPNAIKLKLTPSGEIIWKPVEQKMYTKEDKYSDMRNAAYEAFVHPNTFADGIIFSETKFKEWFDKNYPE